MEATHNLLTSHRCPWESGTGHTETFGEDRVQSSQCDWIFWSFRVTAYSFSVCRTFRFCFCNFSYLILQFSSYCTSSYTSLMLCYIGKTSPACFFSPNNNERFHEVAYSFDCFLPAMQRIGTVSIWTHKHLITREWLGYRMDQCLLFSDFFFPICCLTYICW